MNSKIENTPELVYLSNSDIKESVRYTIYRNEGWFVLLDVLKAINAPKNTSIAIAKCGLGDEECIKIRCSSKRGYRDMNLINKSGLKRVIAGYSWDKTLSTKVGEWLAGAENAKGEPMDICQFCSKMINSDVSDEDINFYKDMLNDAIEGIDPNIPPLEAANMPSLIAMVAWSCQQDKDRAWEEWITDYLERTNAYKIDQAENFKIMKSDFVCFEAYKMNAKTTEEPINKITRAMVAELNEDLKKKDCIFKFRFAVYRSGITNALIEPLNDKWIMNCDIKPDLAFYMWVAIWFKEKYNLIVSAYYDYSGFYKV